MLCFALNRLHNLTIESVTVQVLLASNIKCAAKLLNRRFINICEYLTKSISIHHKDCVAVLWRNLCGSLFRFASRSSACWRRLCFITKFKRIICVSSAFITESICVFIHYFLRNSTATSSSSDNFSKIGGKYLGW